MKTHPVMHCGVEVDVCEEVVKPLKLLRCARCKQFIWLHDPYEWTRNNNFRPRRKSRKRTPMPDFDINYLSDAVWLIARRFWSRGDRDVTITARGGLSVTHNGERRVYGVLRHKKTWTDRKSYGEGDFVVTKAAEWDKVDPKPTAFFHVNDNLSHVAIVSGTTAGTWKRANRGARVYVCGLDMVRFESLTAP